MDKQHHRSEGKWVFFFYLGVNCLFKVCIYWLSRVVGIFPNLRKLNQNDVQKYTVAILGESKSLESSSNTNQITQSTFSQWKPPFLLINTPICSSDCRNVFSWNHRRRNESWVKPGLAPFGPAVRTGLWWLAKRSIMREHKDWLTLTVRGKRKGTETQRYMCVCIVCVIKCILSESTSV